MIYIIDENFLKTYIHKLQFIIRTPY